MVESTNAHLRLQAAVTLTQRLPPTVPRERGGLAMSSPSQETPETQEAQQTEETEDTEQEQGSESQVEYGPQVGGDIGYDISVDEESPFVVVPRGGAKEIGRSCYQVETRQGTYLVDIGLNQGDGGLFPDLRGLENRQIDAVFLTHAHIDHVGSLPLLESYGLLSRQAPVITTRPTTALADTLLRDSLKLHRRASQKPGREQLYTEKHLRKVIDRFRPCGYQAANLHDHIAHVDETETLHFEFGNAGHLLGSSWLALTADGSRVVFSGDLGGRSNHLPDIADPPQADALFLESTYGGTHSHTSASDTRTDIYNEAISAAVDGEPVLIPCFGVGRSQELLYTFKNRTHSLPDEAREQVRIVFDGMSQNATDTYNQHCKGEFAAESIRNYVVNSGDERPFFFDEAVAARRLSMSRSELLDRKDKRTPIIIAPSGMLSGGFSPTYLLEFCQRYDDAHIILCGYQAEGTPGRQLEDSLEEDIEEVGVTLPSNGLDGGVPERDEGTRVKVPVDWISRYHGLSGHAARNTLLQFARQVSPSHVYLIHGEQHQQEQMATHLAENLRSVSDIQLTGMMHPVSVTPDRPDEDSIGDRPAKRVLDKQGSEIDVKDTPELRPEVIHGQLTEFNEQIEALELALRSLSGQLAVDRHGNGLSEAEVRAIVREELDNVVRDEVDEIIREEIDEIVQEAVEQTHSD